jgi:hypothetical protein
MRVYSQQLEAVSFLHLRMPHAVVIGDFLKKIFCINLVSVID